MFCGPRAHSGGPQPSLRVRAGAHPRSSTASQVATCRALARTGDPPCIDAGAGLRRNVRIAPEVESFANALLRRGWHVGANDRLRPRAAAGFR
jgi:hypothetical protein